MKNIKKILALVLALVMILGISSVALAADALTGGSASSSAATGLQEISFTTQIANNNGQAPATAYKYTISLPSGSTSPLKDGVADGVVFKAPDSSANTLLKTVTWSVSDGTAAKTVELTLDPTVFTQPGTYRYLITQSSDDATEQTAIGLTADTNPDKALDLYVKWKDASDHTQGCIISQAVLTEDAKSVTVSATTITHATKVEGWVNRFGSSTDPTDPNAPTESKKLTLSKTVSGSKADTAQLFDFALTLTYNDSTTNSTTLSGMTFKVYTDSGLTTTLKDGSNNDVEVEVDRGSVTVQLKDGDHLYIALPKALTVNFKETYANAEMYQIESAVSGLDSATSIAHSANATSDANGSGGVTKGEDASIAYTNTLDDISATGVALRVAPFVMILAAGCLMLVIGKRRKEQEA